MSYFIEQLKRRGVFRIAAAYLAILWLLLQILDVLEGILNLPDSVARVTFLTLLFGFPIVLVLGWVYDITPEGVKYTREADATAPEVKFGGRGIDLVIIGALSLVIILLVVDDYLLPHIEELVESDEVPVVSGYRQLTRSAVLFPPFPSNVPIVADESRLYFNTWENGQLKMRQMSRAGGETYLMESNFDRPGVFVDALAPGGTHLSISYFDEEGPPSLWLLPVVGGSPWRLGPGQIANYSADGKQITYAREGGNKLMLAQADLTGARSLGNIDGSLHWPAFSPDGREIRFYLPDRDGDALWKIPTDGGEASPLFPEAKFSSHCCGSWTPDGKYFVFQATIDNRTQLWAIRERGSGPPADASSAVQITSGPLKFVRPTIADGGRIIYAIGWQLRGEVVHLDRQSGQFLPVPGLESLSAQGLTYSRDGRWLAYLSFPEGDLWRSTSAGERKLQLTRAPLRVQGAAWSPDGKTIAFEGRKPYQAQRIYLVSAEGGAPRLATGGDDSLWQWSPSWSPDGASLVFSEEDKPRLQLLDLASGTVSGMEGTEGLRTPAWSPDGRYLALESRDELKLFDIEKQRVELLLADPGYSWFTWSEDSRFIYLVGSAYQKERWVVRLNIDDKTMERMVDVGEQRKAHGTLGPWVGVTADGIPMFLRDQSIHHIYALDWLPESKAAEW